MFLWISWQNSDTWYTLPRVCRSIFYIWLNIWFSHRWWNIWSFYYKVMPGNLSREDARTPWEEVTPWRLLPIAPLGPLEVSVDDVRLPKRAPPGKEGAAGDVTDLPSAVVEPSYWLCVVFDEVELKTKQRVRNKSKLYLTSLKSAYYARHNLDTKSQFIMK